MFIYLFIWLLWVLVATLGIFGDLWGSLGTFHCHAQILWLWQYLVQLLPSMWDLSSWTRNQTRVSCFARWTLNHWTTREVPKNYIFKIQKKKKKKDIMCLQGWGIMPTLPFFRFFLKKKSVFKMFIQIQIKNAVKIK